VAGGYVADYAIDDDYIVMNNSVINVVEPPVVRDESGAIIKQAREGDIIVLIKTSGAYHKGVITAIDTKELTISYKDIKELFNDNIVNPMVDNYLADSAWSAKYDAVGITAALIQANWMDTLDSYRKLPIRFILGGAVTAIWEYKDNSIDFREYLLAAFEKYNVVLDFYIDFNRNGDPRTPYIALSINCVVDSGAIIKDTSLVNTFIYEEAQLPEKTVCMVLSQQTKQLLETFYLRSDNTVTTYINDEERLLPVKTAVVELDETNKDGITALDLAKENLCGNTYNHIVQIESLVGNKVIDFDYLRTGYGVKIINAQGTIDSIYTGRKEKSDNNVLTLIFGKGRRNYTDKIILALRKIKRR
jgi:hypothetical protein